MFWTVFTFELAYWFKRPLTLLFFALFFLMAFFSTASDSFLSVGGTGQIHRNAPFVLAIAMGILTAIGQVITTAIAGTAVLRDSQLGTEEMLFTTRLSKAGYLLGRFAGAFVIMAVDLRGAADRTARRHADAVGAGRQARPDHARGWSLQPFLLIALPNLLFVSALLFAVGALTRKLFAVYVTGIVLLVAWQITQQIIGQLDRLALAALVDPFALTTTQVDDPLLERRGEEHAADSVRRRDADESAHLDRDRDRAVRTRRRGVPASAPTRPAARKRKKADAAADRARRGRFQRSRFATTAPRGVARSCSRALFHLRSIVREPPFLAISGDLRDQPAGRRVVHVASRRLGALAGDVDRSRRASPTALFVFIVLLGDAVRR